MSDLIQVVKIYADKNASAFVGNMSEPVKFTMKYDVTLCFCFQCHKNVYDLKGTTSFYTDCNNHVLQIIFFLYRINQIIHIISYLAVHVKVNSFVINKIKTLSSDFKAQTCGKHVVLTSDGKTIDVCYFYLRSSGSQVWFHVDFGDGKTQQIPGIPASHINVDVTMYAEVTHTYTAGRWG